MLSPITAKLAWKPDPVPIRSSFPILRLLHPLCGINPLRAVIELMIRLSPVAGAGGLHEREDGGIIANGGHEGIAEMHWNDGNQLWKKFHNK